MESGSGLAFVAYAHAIGAMQSYHLWSIMFFLTLALLAIDSQFTLFEVVLTFTTDQWPTLRRKRWMIVITYSLVFFILGLPSVSRGGVYFTAFINKAVLDFTTLFCAIAEVVCFSYLYGFRKFSDDITMMIGLELRDKNGKLHMKNLFWNRYGNIE